MNLYIKETGLRNSKSIIFLHGCAMAGWIWDEQVRDLGEYHCIIPDLPEHGQSNNVKSFTIKKTAEIIIDLINNKTTNSEVNLVGISLGAQIVLQILSKSPELVDHVVISGTLVHNNTNIETRLKLLDYTVKTYEPVKNTEFFIKANMRTYNMPKNFFNKFKESTHIIKPDSLDRIFREHVTYKLPNDLENVQAPVLIITGEKDYKIITESAKDLLRSLPNSEGYIAPNVGHIWNLEDPKLFNSVMRQWIENKTLKRVTN
jgi:pimeloyl-ACP methyl ester carboxylesterase